MNLFFWGLNVCVDFDLRNPKTKRGRNNIFLKQKQVYFETGFPKLGFITILCLQFRAQGYKKLTTTTYYVLSVLEYFQ